MSNNAEKEDMPNWDDSDSEDENVVVEEKPMIMPRARQPSIAKSLEKVAILENSVAGSVKNDDDNDDLDSDMSSENSEDYEDDATDDVGPLTLDFDMMPNTKKMISLFPCDYINIVSEFADVEIFLISFDSLVIECAAHKYHDWQNGGQSVLIAKQLDRFLQQFVDLGGKFKLVVFTDLMSIFAKDTVLAFARATALAHLSLGPFAEDILYFSCPLDESWKKLLYDLTPSFLMISIDNVTREVCAQEDVDFSQKLELIALDALLQSVPIVPLYSIVVNFSSVEAFYISPRLVTKHDYEGFMAAHWDNSGEILRNAKNPALDVSKQTTSADLWVKIIQDAKQNGAKLEKLEPFCCAVLLSALVCAKRGTQRVYPQKRENAKRGLDVIQARRMLLETATSVLERGNFATSKLKLADFWDGRMVFGIFDDICAQEKVLPYRLQEEFCKLHQQAGLLLSLETDSEEKLFKPLPEVKDPLGELPVFYETNSAMLKRFVPELPRLASTKSVSETSPGFVDYTQHFEKLGWKLKQIEEEFAKKPEVAVKTDNLTQSQLNWVRRKANRQRQTAVRWYNVFANSLEGRNTSLLVDFSRVPKGFAMADDDGANDEKKKGKAWAGQKGGGGGPKKGGAGGKDAAKSKKEAIMEANKKAKDSKIVEGERMKIKYGMQQGSEAVIFLENLYPSLELPETKASCTYQITVREHRILVDTLQGPEKVEERRTRALKLVKHLKECMTKHWDNLEDRHKEQVVDMWVSLGFDAPKGSKPSSEAKQKKLDLKINVIYYQLQYGGEIIDIQSDPKKDDRVSGFAPDAWQRRLLDAVDRGKSALIVAPTSAGKTFISYYCIEKVLRTSDDDVVVYVSPSKALLNQVCGSIYARFRNKTMTGAKSLFGTLTPEYGQNQLNCQVLVTVPESLQELLLSRTSNVQQFASRIKCVIFDEVHSIGASEESHVWEQLLLMIQCPFLALSATIGNADKLHEWLNRSELAKSNGKREVEMIIYSERYSELELSILKIDDPAKLQEINEDGSQNGNDEPKKKTLDEEKKELVLPLMPYGVYMPEKLRMFSIPDDQQLTARQILQLYTMMSQVDEATKKEFEPCNFYGDKGGRSIWISRATLRELENGLKKRFLDWLNANDPKLDEILNLWKEPVKEQLAYRSVPFNKERVAKEYITSLVQDLRNQNMLPAICFNEDRQVCETLAEQLELQLQELETEFMESAEFKAKYEIRDEEKLAKLALKQAEAALKRRVKTVNKKKTGDERDEARAERQNAEVDDGLGDPLAVQKARLADALSRFRLRGRRGGDPELYEEMISRMVRGGKSRESTKKLLRMFERGIGFHHPGLNTNERSAVEVLFRQGQLGIIFSTSTLSLGVNMPCKTVLFGVDTPQLTPLLYRQMSGRAGRRGFDHSGSVIFMSVPTSKVRRLLTASLSNLQGNPPFTVTFLLRLLAYVHEKDVKNDVGQPVSTIQQRAHMAMSLLGNSFSLVTRREAQMGTLQKQLRLYSAYAVQLMRHLQLVSVKGEAQKMAELAMYVQAGESGILLFIYLLQKGCIHKFLKSAQNSEEARRRMLVVLANLFTNTRVNYNPEEHVDGNYKVVLEGLPVDLQTHANEFNTLVMAVYKKFLAASADDNSLVESTFLLSGKVDESSMSFSNEELIKPIFDGYSHDASFLPVVLFDNFDHRGRKLYRNAFAIDFYTHMSRNLLHTVNKLPVATMWYKISDFLTIMKRLATGLESVARPKDIVTETIRDLHAEYSNKFHKVFGMRSRD